MSEEQLYKVDPKRIRIPFPNKRKKGKTNFLRSLSVGESFVINKNDGKENLGNWNLLARRANMKICIRKIGDGKHRIWLTEKNGVKLDEQK